MNLGLAWREIQTTFYRGGHVGHCFITLDKELQGDTSGGEPGLG